jgi:ribosomal protein L32
MSNLQYAADRILVLYNLHEILTVEKRKKSEVRRRLKFLHNIIPSELVSHLQVCKTDGPIITVLLVSLSAVATCSLQPARLFSPRASM